MRGEPHPTGEAPVWRAVVVTTAVTTWTVVLLAVAVLVHAEVQDVSGLDGFGHGLLLVLLVAVAGMTGLVVAAALVVLRLRCGPGPVTLPLLALAAPPAALPALLAAFLALS